MKSIILKVILVLLLFILLRPLLNAGFPDTHDGVNHLARMANYAVALKQGQFPPRIAPTFMAGYGYPVFNYNYPLASILALPFLTVHIPVETTLKIITIVGILVGMLGAYKFLRIYLTEESALYATGTYLAAPFLFNNLYIRGVIGETLAYALFPHVLIGIHMLFRNINRGSMVYTVGMTAAFMLSHNIFVMFMAPLIALYVLFLMMREKKAVLSYAPIVSVLLLGVGLSMFFWIPAVFEQGYANIALVNLTQFYSQHFPTLQQLLFAPFSYGLSYPGPVDTLSYNMGMLFTIAGLFALAYIIGRTKHESVMLLFLFAGVLVIFFMLPASLFIWEKIPLFHFIQFPWRLLGILALFGAVLSGCVYEDSHNTVRWVFITLLCIATVIVGSQQITQFVHHDDMYYKTYAETSTVQHEDQPSTFSYVPIELSKNIPLFSEGEVIATNVWNGSHRIYALRIPKEEKVTEQIAYFPGWKTFVDNKEVPIEYWNAEGQIQFTVPAGTHRIETVFTQDTLARKIGNTITVLSFLILTFVLLLQLFSANNQHRTEQNIYNE